MPAPAFQPATYADLCALPPERVGEIVNGTLYSQPRPAPRHAVAASVLGSVLGPPFHRGRGGTGGWWIIDEPEWHLGPHVLVPDMAGWRRGRMPVLPETAWFELAPDWVCEVLSPGTVRLDRVSKMPLYAGFGIMHTWLVDPIARTLEAFRLDDGDWKLIATYSDDDRIRVPPFEAEEFDLGELWK